MNPAPSGCKSRDLSIDAIRRLMRDCDSRVYQEINRKVHPDKNVDKFKNYMKQHFVNQSFKLLQRFQTYQHNAKNNVNIVLKSEDSLCIFFFFQKRKT